MKKLLILAIIEILILCLLFNRAYCQYAKAAIGLQAAGINASTPGAQFHWRKVFGGYCVIQAPDSAHTIVNSLQAGIYRFELKVTFISGNIARDTVQVTVLKRRH